jgi:uncharacterized protein YbbC (DUF1343 family)
MRTGHYALGFWLVVSPWIGCAPRMAAGGPVRSSAADAEVRPGIEVLLSDSLSLVRGRRVGLVTNQTGVDRAGVSDVERLLGAGIPLVAIFSPEHGFRGTADPGAVVRSSTDSATGLPIYSLYGKTSAPTDSMLAGIDVLLVDLQDAGARYFTYLWTTVEVMRSAERKGIPVVVLDRPNPIGDGVQGNVLDTAFRSPVGLLAIPMRHGMTLGELARLAQHDMGLHADLHVVPVAGWKRSMYFDATGLPFVPPSPNLRSLEALIHYPGTCLFEGTNLSVGRGTEHAFEQLAAPWVDTTAVLGRLAAARLPGVRFVGVSFTPVRPGDGKYADTLLAGIRLVVTDRERYDPTRTALALLASFGPEMRFVPRQFDRLAGDAGRLREALASGGSDWAAADSLFRLRRRPFLIYPE